MRVTSFPESLMVPRQAGRNPSTVFNSEVLPIPFRPTIASTSDFASVKDTSLTTSDVP